MQIDQPEPGFYEMRRVARGPWVAVYIHHGYKGLTAHVDGKPVDPYQIWPWCGGRPISAARYKWRRRLARWARTWNPFSPEANPTKPVDVSRIPPPKFK